MSDQWNDATLYRKLITTSIFRAACSSTNSKMMIHCPKHGVMTESPDTQYSSMCLKNAQSIHTAAFGFYKDGMKITTSGWRRWVWFDHCWYWCARSEITPDTTVTQMLDWTPPAPMFLYFYQTIHTFNSLVIQCESHRLFVMWRMYVRCWYGAQCLRAVMW